MCDLGTLSTKRFTVTILLQQKVFLEQDIWDCYDKTYGANVTSEFIWYTRRLRRRNQTLALVSTPEFNSNVQGHFGPATVLIRPVYFAQWPHMTTTQPQHSHNKDKPNPYVNLIFIMFQLNHPTWIFVSSCLIYSKEKWGHQNPFEIDSTLKVDSQSECWVDAK